MHRLLAAIVGVLFIAGLMGQAPTVAAATHPPKVVIVVGPVGQLTDRYRDIGAAAAREAARRTPDVVTVASPNATWPAVRTALQGASIVVYLGHGNGFPSPYRSEPYPRTQNGLGLNPVAGVDDDAHQYFGESFLAKAVRLAPHAIVVLSHLCYASGAGEPGDPDPTSEVARQRADNFAAGWIASGAQAVIADAFGRPDEYIRRLFSSGESVEHIWRSATTHHDNVVRLSSSRTPSATVLLDPTRPGHGYYRSLVRVPSPPAAVVLRPSDTKVAVPASADPVVPSLAKLGAHVDVPVLTPTPAPRALVAGTPALLKLPITVPKGVAMPKDLRIGVRWQPLEPAAKAPAAAPLDKGSSSPAVPSPAGAEPPPIDLVAVEQPGDVLASAPAIWRHGGLNVAVDLPVEPGRYRLTTTIHDAQDVALDLPTQALVAVLIVQVSRPVSVAYGFASDGVTSAGVPFTFPLRLANNGSLPWSNPPQGLPLRGGRTSHQPPTMILRWLPLDAPDVDNGFTAIAGPILEPGEETVVPLALTAPAEPGRYLLVIDLITPLHGSMAAAGCPVAQARITVDPVDPALVHSEGG